MMIIVQPPTLEVPDRVRSAELESDPGAPVSSRDVSMLRVSVSLSLYIYIYIYMYVYIRLSLSMYIYIYI